MSSHNLINIKKETMHIKEVQDTLRRLKNTNISQGDIAKAIGTTRSNVSQLFAKNSSLDDEKIEKIEKFFNIKFDTNGEKSLENLIKVPVYSGYDMENANGYIYISGGKNAKPLCPFAIEVASDSMAPYINRGDFAVFDGGFNSIEDGKIFLIRFEGNFFIKRILDNINNIILKSDNRDYTDISINSFKNEKIEVVGRLHSLLRFEI